MEKRLATGKKIITNSLLMKKISEKCDSYIILIIDVFIYNYNTMDLSRATKQENVKIFTENLRKGEWRIDILDFISQEKLLSLLPAYIRNMVVMMAAGGMIEVQGRYIVNLLNKQPSIAPTEDVGKPIGWVQFIQPEKKPRAKKGAWAKKGTVEAKVEWWDVPNNGIDNLLPLQEYQEEMEEQIVTGQNAIHITPWDTDWSIRVPNITEQEPSDPVDFKIGPTEATELARVTEDGEVKVNWEALDGIDGYSDEEEVEDEYSEYDHPTIREDSNFSIAIETLEEYHNMSHEGKVEWFGKFREAYEVREAITYKNAWDAYHTGIENTPYIYDTFWFPQMPEVRVEYIKTDGVITGDGKNAVMEMNMKLEKDKQEYLDKVAKKQAEEEEKNRKLSEFEAEIMDKLEREEITSEEATQMFKDFNQSLQ